MAFWEDGARRFGQRLQGLGRAIEEPGRLRRRLARAHLDEELMALASRPYVHSDDVRTLLDVGANEGQFARTALQAFPRARVHCFEPLPSVQETLGVLAAASAGRLSVEPIALGDKNGEIAFNVTSFSPSSSALPLASNSMVKMDLAEATRVPARRLDDWALGRELEGDIVLKLDVQGYEGSVLRGAVNFLSRARIVIAETCFTPLYEGQATLGELCGILEPLGFRYREAFGVIREPRAGEPLWQDSVFVRLPAP
jgi:FkbM family methyltransferase